MEDGPAGIASAVALSRYGITSTIFERESYLGGILMYGIPDFRLNKTLVKDSIALILNDHIKIEFNKTFSQQEKGENKDSNIITTNDLKEQGFDYVFLGYGLENSKLLSLNSTSNKVLGANGFLRNLNQTSAKSDLDNKSTATTYVGKTIAVIGGGNVAIDSARTAKKHGARAIIIYRRTEQDMPANLEEVGQAKEEGVEFIFKNNVIKIEEINQKLKLTLDNNDSMEVDYLVEAIGANINKNYLDKNIKLNDYDLIDVTNQYETSEKNIFAGGDLVQNKSTVADAIKTGIDFANIIFEKEKHK